MSTEHGFPTLPEWRARAQKAEAELARLLGPCDMDRPADLVTLCAAANEWARKAEAERDAARAEVAEVRLTLDRVARERDKMASRLAEAMGTSRVLAMAWIYDARPPETVVATARKYPVDCTSDGVRAWLAAIDAARKEVTP